MPAIDPVHYQVNDPARAEADALLRGARLRQTYGGLVNFAVIAVTASLFALLVIALGLMWMVLSLWSKPLTPPPVAQGANFVETMGNMLEGAVLGVVYTALETIRHFLVVLAIALPPAIYAAIYLLPFLLTLPLTAPLIGLWSDPPRLLLLRPFNRGRVSGALRQVVRQEIGPFGHVYTLSDADIRVPWLVRVPLLLGQVALLSFRVRRVRKASHIARLEDAIDRVWLRNINWCMSIGNAFPVSTVDACWQAVVRSLVERADVVIIDATELRPNVMWEVELCRELRRDDRILFLASAGTWAQTVDRLRASLPAPDLEYRVFPYDADGVAPPTLPAFRARLATLAASGLAERRGGAPRRAGGWLGITAVTLFSCQVLPLLCLALASVGLLPDLSPRHMHVVLAAGAVTLALLLAAAARQRTFRPLAVLQGALLLVAVVGMLI